MENNSEDITRQIITGTSQSESATENQDDYGASFQRRSKILSHLGLQGPLFLEASREIIDEALKGQDVEMRAAAVRTLGNIDEWDEWDRETVVLLLKHAINDYAAEVRIAALQSLGTLREHAAIPLFTSVLRNGNDEFVQETAVIVLGTFGESAPIGALRLALQSQYWRVRAAAIQSLMKVGSQAILDPLQLALQDPDSSVRCEAIHALGMLRGKMAIDPLVLIAQEDKDGLVRETALFALEMSGEHELVSRLRKSLDELLAMDEEDLGSIEVGVSIPISQEQNGVVDNANGMQGFIREIWRGSIHIWQRGRERGTQAIQTYNYQLHAHFSREKAQKKWYTYCWNWTFIIAIVVILTGGCLLHSNLTPSQARGVPYTYAYAFSKVLVPSAYQGKRFRVALTIENQANAVWSDQENDGLICNMRKSTRGECMGLTIVRVGSLVPHGRRNIAMTLVAPLKPGKYTLWLMLRQGDKTFSNNQFITIDVR
jgi:hypothetical protein